MYTTLMLIKTKLKQVLLGTTALLLLFAISMPLKVLANHQQTQLGDVPTYAHFGQPHGYIISGDFTFIMATHGKIDRAEFKVTKAGDANNVLGTYSSTSVIPGADGDSLYNLVWNSSGFADGDYWLFGNIYAYGETWTDFARHYDGKGRLDFSVKNPVAPPPVSGDPAESNCKDDLGKAKKLADQIYEKQNKNLLFIDNFLQQTTLFYEKNVPDAPGKAAELAKVAEVRKTASDSLVTLNKLGDFTCEASLKDQVNEFLNQADVSRDSLDAYKDSVINLILKVLEQV